jgi:hypothetical protein
MGVRRHLREDNTDWEHIKAQVEDALEFYVKWDIEDLYSPTTDRELIVTLADALDALAECMGIQTITYGKEQK